MPYLLVGNNLLRFNLLQRVKTKRHTGFFNLLILLGKRFFSGRFCRRIGGSNACLKYL
jgi:hypothetical protein